MNKRGSPYEQLSVFSVNYIIFKILKLSFSSPKKFPNTNAYANQKKAILQSYTKLTAFTCLHKCTPVRSKYIYRPHRGMNIVSRRQIIAPISSYVGDASYRFEFYKLREEVHTYLIQTIHIYISLQFTGS